MEKIRIDYTNKIINPQKLWGIFFIDKDNINYLFINIYLLTICLSFRRNLYNFMKSFC